MHRAFELARLGLGHTTPNPMVGCVIVKDNQIIGEGWHRKYGGPHAEVNAVKDANKNGSVQGSDVYVTLEPCSHVGNTPPCADMLIKEKVQRVFVANRDINPLVSGKGLQRMRDAGIEVFENLMVDEEQALNKRFICFHRNKRPYVILKWAQTADGFIARKNYDSKWISNEYSRQITHKWRSEEAAIMVGANTVIHDDPSLNVRDWDGTDPVRIIIDPHLRIPADRKIFDRRIKTYVYNFEKNESEQNLEFVKIGDSSLLNQVLHHLHSINIQSVLVEGGAHVLNAFQKSGQWDEARVFISNTTFGEGIQAPQMQHAALSGMDFIFNDELKIFTRVENNG